MEGLGVGVATGLGATEKGLTDVAVGHTGRVGVGVGDDGGRAVGDAVGVGAWTGMGSGGDGSGVCAGRAVGVGARTGVAEGRDAGSVADCCAVGVRVATGRDVAPGVGVDAGLPAGTKPGRLSAKVTRETPSKGCAASKANPTPTRTTPRIESARKSTATSHRPLPAGTWLT